MRERLIGAIVLVVAAVILIPWLVSRAHHPREQVRSLPLPAAATSSAPRVLSLPPADVKMPGTSAGGTHPSTPAASPAGIHVTPPPATRKPAVPKGGRSGSTADGWSVQAASFSSRGDADGLAGKLSKAGFHAYVSPHAVKGRTWYRVSVGPYPDGTAARAAAAGISRVSGTKAIVRENDGSRG